MSHVRRKPTKRPVRTIKKKSKRNWTSLIIMILILFSGIIGIIFLVTFT